MAEKWLIRARYIKNCSCDPGCPCDFNAEPTQHFCDGMLGLEITDGHYGNVRLDGLRVAVTYHWPGPLHEGNGTVQPFIDERATEEQRQALLTIFSGQAGGAWFELLASIIATILDPQFVPIEFEFDKDGRKARMTVAGQFETVTEPIKNPVTGEEHRVQVQMPEGVEYRMAETATAVVNRGTGAIKYDHPNSHSSVATIEWSN